MSYNCDDVSYIGEGRLSITSTSLVELKRCVSEDERPALNFIDYIDPILGDQVIDRPYWEGEGSGRSFEKFLKALSYTTGNAELVLCWEGGDCYSGIRIRNGIITEHEMVFALGKST